MKIYLFYLFPTLLLHPFAFAMHLKILIESKITVEFNFRKDHVVINLKRRAFAKKKKNLWYKKTPAATRNVWSMLEAL